jgi:hypothetical protein
MISRFFSSRGLAEKSDSLAPSPRGDLRGETRARTRVRPRRGLLSRWRIPAREATRSRANRVTISSAIRRAGQSRNASRAGEPRDRDSGRDARSSRARGRTVEFCLKFLAREPGTKPDMTRRGVSSTASGDSEARASRDVFAPRAARRRRALARDTTGWFHFGEHSLALGIKNRSAPRSPPTLEQTEKRRRFFLGPFGFFGERRSLPRRARHR